MDDRSAHALTLATLHADERARQAEFPVVRERIYLAHAGVCPLPRRVAEAVQGYAGSCTQADQEMCLPEVFLGETRALAARLLGAAADEVALIGPTSAALSAVAAGVRLRRGANVLVYLDDYPSNVYPWMAMADRGVEVRFLNTRELGRIRLADLMGQVDEDTRLVALASCHFLSGYRIELPAIGRWLRERGILFCVDGIQTLGAFPTPVEWVDCLAADAHKWLLGPAGAGILWVRREVQEQIQPILLGWHNVRCPDFVTQENLVLRGDARRYEAGSHNLLGIVALRAALELALEVGVEGIAAELQRQRTWLVGALSDKNYAVLNANPPPGNISGIVSFWQEGADMASLHTRLAEAGVVTSLRADRSGRRYVRLSPHYYNTDAELRLALAVL